MNNKGYDYAALMVIVVIIAVSTLYVQVLKKTQGFEHEIGDTQAPVLKLNSEVTLYEVFVRESAKLAVGECLSPSWTSAALNKRLNGHLQAYAARKQYNIPRDNFEIVFTGKELAGVALLPTEIPLKTKEGKQIGTALFKPSFSVSTPICNYELFA
ncbi:MAG TPA: hypothetical protein VJJ82_03780 [Candidatus Nanoarchaeia archaeon]|nr:hypothetical protein [Candidatus Nanoarchaeia archaeon]